MTIVLPYKDDILSEWELKFALRSIEKFLTGYTNLILIGDRPEWYQGESVYHKDINGRKQFNIYSKLLVACELNNVTDDFVMFNDDHYLFKRLDVSEIKYWYDGYLKDTVGKSHGVRYLETIKNTLKIIPETLNYDVHTPIIYKKETLRWLFTGKQDEVCIKSYYCSSLETKGEYMKDLKINQLLSYEAILRLTLEKMFFSTSTNGMKKPMMKFLNEAYPNPSQWEK